MKKLAIVTGGNTGLGLACTRSILKHPDWQVMIACRNEASGNEAVRQLTQELAGGCHASVSHDEQQQRLVPRVSVLLLDLASLDSIRAFERAFAQRKSTLPPLTALVCNAGVQTSTSVTLTRDGFESTFGVNHLGHFLFVNLMLRHLAPATTSNNLGRRVVFVASEVHDPQQPTGMPPPRYSSARDLALINVEAANANPTQFGQIAYTTSKLCNVLCAYELARKLTPAVAESIGGPITVSAFDPGLMPGTGLARDYSAIMRFGWNWILPYVAPLIKRNTHTAADSGAALARVAIDPSLESPSAARYYEGVKEIRSSTDSYNTDYARDLWAESVRLVRLTEQEVVHPTLLQ